MQILTNHVTLLYYTEKFVVLYRIIRYSVNEFAYNEGLISWDVGFVISRGDCSLYGEFFACDSAGAV